MRRLALRSAGLPLLPLLPLLVALPPAPATAQAPDPAERIAWARGLSDADVAAFDHDTAMAAAEWLWVWPQMTGRGAPVGTTEDYLASLRRAQRLFRAERARAPRDAATLWKLARANYDIGELLPEDAVAERTALYEEMIAACRHCVDQVDTGDAGCWHFLATGIGRLATTRGMFASLASADDVEEAWLKAYALRPTLVELNGDPMLNNVRYGLGVFYRMVPDAWIIKLLTGTRGDIGKSIRYFRDAVAAQPARLELSKELAVALLCQAERDDDRAAGDEGRRILERLARDEPGGLDRRATDAIDRRHAGELLRFPARACGYSRDGYEDTDVKKLETTGGGG